jgi:hypothetical protein
VLLGGRAGEREGAELRAWLAACAQVEAEIAALKSLRAEDVAAAKRTQKKRAPAPPPEGAAQAAVRRPLRPLRRPF